MRKIKWTTGLISGLLVMSAILAGCGGGNNNGTGQTDGTDSSKKITIELMADLGTGGVLPAPDKDMILQELNKTLNIDLKMNLSTDYQNKLNIRVAGSDAPDIFNIGKSQLKQFSDQNVLLDFMPYKDQLKDLQNYLGEFFDSGTVDGKMHYIPMLPGMSARYFTYWIRQDWLDHLNLKLPTTLEELINVAKAFTFNDPDGNKKNDTYGISGQGLSAFAPIFGAYGIPMAGWTPDVVDEVFVDDNGEFSTSLQAPGMKEALALINRLIDDGSVDPELLANKSPDVQKKAYQGQVGIVLLDWASLTKDEYVEEYQTVNPNAEWAQLPAIQGPYGRSNTTWPVTVGSGGIAVSKALEKDPEKLKRVLQLLNYLGSEEGSRLTMFGVKGVTYHVDENNAVVPTELLAKEGAYFFLYQRFGRDDQAYLYSKFQKQIPYIDMAFADPHTKVYTGGVDLPDAYNSADANRFIQEGLVKFVYGKDAIDNYDAFLNTLKTQFKQDLFWEAAKEYLKTQGVIK